MATLRERSPGVWQVRVFTGRDGAGTPTQVAVSVRGTKRDALREAAKLESAPHRGAAGRTVADVLQAWLELHEGSWAPASLRDQTSRVRLIEADPIAKMVVACLGVADVDQWLTRMREAGVGQSAVRNRLVALRAALHQAQVWGWVTANPAALSRSPRLKQAPRDALTPEEVIAVIEAATGVDPIAGGSSAHVSVAVGVASRGSRCRTSTIWPQLRRSLRWVLDHVAWRILAGLNSDGVQRRCR